MINNFDLPGLACENCKGKLSLQVEAAGPQITHLKVICRQCGWEENILEKTGETYEAAKKQFKKSVDEITKALVKLKDSLPKNKEEWTQVVKNPKHPFTATLLAGLALILMEMSGFGVFVVVTWILGNFILNPFGWVLVPLIVAIGFTYRRHFKQEKLSELKMKLKELEQQRDAGTLSKEDYEREKDKILKDFFGE